MDETQVEKMKGYIFAQLDEFESNPPFTIQRLCELCLYPLRHYRSVGKYLRAVEKTLFVTSTWDSFPSSLDDRSRPMIGPGVKPRQKSPPKTPLFSPIPFLHGDARRSASTSPPPSPLTLATSERAIGMVDELDDPAPGHMSEHPIALTSVTTTNESTTPSTSSGSRPIFGSLEERFVKAEEEKKETADEDKESGNKSS
ncbi:hypothetical protein AX16_004250 [Volvariella volvacea WC 439]|nr:hypothetical protein AX16_004250 [Volvariella volvacea WC 439]